MRCGIRKREKDRSKKKKSGLKTIQNWLNEDPNSNYVFFREDGDKDNWIVIMPVMEFIELTKKAEGMME